MNSSHTQRRAQGWQRHCWFLLIIFWAKSIVLLTISWTLWCKKRIQTKLSENGWTIEIKWDMSILVILFLLVELWPHVIKTPEEYSVGILDSRTDGSLHRERRINMTLLSNDYFIPTPLKDTHMDAQTQTHTDWRSWSRGSALVQHPNPFTHLRSLRGGGLSPVGCGTSWPFLSVLDGATGRGYLEWWRTELA